MAEERKERCAGCGRELDLNEQVIYIRRLIVSPGKLADIKMWVNGTERNLTPENTYLCSDNPACGANWIKQRLAGIGKES